jgi:hypothetical protein
MMERYSTLVLVSIVEHGMNTFTSQRLDGRLAVTSKFVSSNIL